LIESDYVIRQGRVFVRNADDYLIESGKPFIPVFVREIILPQGSDIEDVRFRGFYRSYRHVSPLVVPWDEYYGEGPEGFSGSYPEDKYWYRTNTLLDGRTLVRVYAPAVIYRRNKAKALRWGRVYLEYDSPVEVMVKAGDIRLGRSGRIEVRISNSGEEELSGTLWLWIGDEEHSRPVDVDAGRTAKEVFKFRPGEAGSYQAKAVFDAGFSSGPRYADFRVWEPCRCSWRGLPFWFRGPAWFWKNRRCDEGLSRILSQRA
jgi:hypothetical protein